MTTTNAILARTRRRRPAIVTAALPYALGLSAFLYLVLSTHVLLLVGWHYVGGGSALQKLHPATYLLGAGLPVALLIDFQFRRRLIGQIAVDPPVVTFILAVVATAVYTTMLGGASVAPFVDTFGGAIMTVVVLTCIPKRPLIFLRLLVDIFFIVNIILIFWEFLVHKDFLSQYLLNFIRTPEEYVVLGPQRAESSFGRMSALFGHPLTAALLFGIYTIATLVSTRLSFSPRSISRLCIVVFSYLAIFPTGSRASMVATTIVIMLYVAQSTMGTVIRGYINAAGLTLSVLVGIAAIFLGIILWNAGFFDQILERFQFDYGSASTRSRALEILQQASTSQLWFGMPQDDLVNIQLGLGMIAIEVSWINFILIGGLITTIPLFVTFCLFIFRSLRKYCAFEIYFVSLLIFESTLASNSIWSKTTAFTSCLIIAICFLRRDLLPNPHKKIAPTSGTRQSFGAFKQIAGARNFNP